MLEIIVAIIIQVATIVNGGATEKEKAELKAKEEKAKTEQQNNAPADGGQGGWSG